jgi:hypothetical protein
MEHLGTGGCLLGDRGAGCIRDTATEEIQSKRSLTGCLDEGRLSSESEPMVMCVQTIKALSGACTPLELAVVNLARSANPIARN